MSQSHHKDVHLSILSVNGQLREVRGTSQIGVYEPSTEVLSKPESIFSDPSVV
jgi:hypothetical protein